MDKIALIVGYAAMLTTTIVCVVVLYFYISDKIAFKKYQKKSDEETMDYARKEIVKSFIKEELCRN